MKEDPILRPEFDLYVKMTAEAMRDIANSTKENARESRETNQILREYIIHNNNKHDETKAHLAHQGKEIDKLKEAVEANSKLTNAATTLKKGVIVFVVALITSVGGYYGVKIAEGQSKIEKPKP